MYHVSLSPWVNFPLLLWFSTKLKSHESSYLQQRLSYSWENLTGPWSLWQYRLWSFKSWDFCLKVNKFRVNLDVFRNGNMLSQQKLGLVLQLNFFRNDLIDNSNKKSFDAKTELVFISKCFYGLEIMKVFVESPTFLILQVLPSLHFKKKCQNFPLHLFIFSQKYI